MKISTKGRYGLRVMIDIASHDKDEYIALKDIATRLNITVKYLEQIVAPLNKAGFLTSMRGNSGGHKMAVSPNECKVGDILRVMEGNLSPVECVASGEIECPLAESCATVTFWKGLDDVVNNYIDSYTLADLLPAKGEADTSK